MFVNVKFSDVELSSGSVYLRKSFTFLMLFKFYTILYIFGPLQVGELPTDHGYATDRPCLGLW